MTTTTSTAPPVSPTAEGPAVAATNALALDLLDRLGAPAQNVVFSPYSIQAALAMVDAGAAGQTAVQIDHVLHSASAAVLARSNGALANRLTAATARPHGARTAHAATLRVANSLWLQSGLSLKPSFTGALAAGFGARPQTADFHGRPEAARAAINAWIASHTANLISHLMPPGSITAQTALVLANAIYLKANWQQEFDPAATASAPFFTAAGRVSAPFMAERPTELAYGRGAGYQAVELPYLHSTLSMLIVMPDAGTIERFERGLNVASLDALARSLQTQMVKLRMPRFHLIAQRELTAVLASLGMPVAFTDQADFSGITAQTPLKISAVEHGADLKVDEHGTIAAAATGISVTPTAVAPRPATAVTLDHPFLVFLRDARSGAILFAGRVANPSES